jgi:GNAT superfamily N-acetyltransferase
MIDLQKIQTGIAGVGDIEELVKLINSAYRGESSKAGWTTEANILDGIRIDAAGVQEIIDESGADLHIFRYPGEGLIACVYLKEENENLYLGMLSVRPTLQAGGIGKYILNYAEERARKIGKKFVRMTVINVRSELIAWYNRHGYVPTGETEPWVDGEHIGDRKADFHFMVLIKEPG